jgi:quercetin dioxygenase-like cupin family protein
MHRFLLSAALLAAPLTFPGQSAAETAAKTPVTTVASDPALKWGPCPPIFPAGCEIAVLHGDPAQPNADVFLRIPGGYEIPAHRHTSAERMILVTGKLRVRYEGAPATTLTVGSYTYGPAKLPHQATCLGDEACTLFIAFESAVDAEPVAAELK